MPKKPQAKQQSKAWFSKVRGSYLPTAKAGWLSYIPFISFLLVSLLTGLRYAGSVLLTVFYVSANWLAATILMTLFAKQHSR